MVTAHIFAQELGPVPKLPASLQEVGRRAQLVDEMDGSFVPNSDELMVVFVQLARRLRAIAEISERIITDMPDGLMRINIALRLWAGCNGGPGRFFGVKVYSSSRCRFLTASRRSCMPSSPETAPW